MLVAKIYINERQIDEVHIQNVGIVNPGTYDNIFSYKIREPKGIDYVIEHNRLSGYGPLLTKALELIEIENLMKGENCESK